MRVLHLIALNKKDKNEMHMARATRKWYKRFEKEGVKTFYYYHTKELKEEDEEEAQTNKTFINILSRKPIGWVEVLDTILTSLDQKFDILIQSDICSVVNFSHLLALFEQRTIPSKTPFYGGPFIVQFTKENLTFEYVHEACIILNDIAVQQLLFRCKKTAQFLPQVEIHLGMLFKIENMGNPIQMGTQYIGFHRNYNLDTISVFHNKDNLQNVLTQVHILLERYFYVAKRQTVKKVLYFGLDVTQQIKDLCTKNTQDKTWKTDQSNKTLDELFGDPMPNMLKTLSIQFLDPQANLFMQCANLTFHFSQDTLSVA